MIPRSMWCSSILIASSSFMLGMWYPLFDGDMTLTILLLLLLVMTMTLMMMMMMMMMMKHYLLTIMVDRIRVHLP